MVLVKTIANYYEENSYGKIATSQRIRIVGSFLTQVNHLTLKTRPIYLPPAIIGPVTAPLRLIISMPYSAFLMRGSSSLEGVSNAIG
jgi:hypothetical protein